MFYPDERASFQEIKQQLEQSANEPLYKLSDVATKTEWIKYFEGDGYFRLSLDTELVEISDINSKIDPVMA